MKFYAVVNPGQLPEIEFFGLNANKKGFIDLLIQNDPIILAHYAWGQLIREKDYGLVEVDPQGITETLVPDVVGEIIYRWQLRVYQNLIEPRFLKSLGVFSFKGGGDARMERFNIINARIPKPLNVREDIIRQSN